MLFSGTSAMFTPYDTVALINIPVANIKGQTTFLPIPFGNIKDLSCQSHRDKFEVRCLCKNSPSGMTGGPRTIGGSFVFASLNIGDFNDAVQRMNDSMNNNVSSKKKKNSHKKLFSLPHTLYPDELPPFDIYVIGSNEYGETGYFKIFGVSILSESTVISTNQITIDNTYVYKAMDRTQWKRGSLGEIKASSNFNTIHDKYNNYMA